MTMFQITDIAVALRDLYVGQQAIRREMVTKKDLDCEIAALRKQMATKADLEGLATKADLEGLATRAELEGLATKADLEDLRRDTARQFIQVHGALESVALELQKLGLEFEKFREDSKVALDGIKLALAKANWHERRLDRLDKMHGLPPLASEG